jgi:uncharacterized Zn-binding protein involved in type VI secretion
MAGSKSNYLETALLDHVYGGGNYTRPATVYIALFTAAPRDTGGGTEVTGGSYVRKAVTNDATNFPAAVAGNPSSKSNGTTISFVTATASWGTVVAFGIFDAVSGGNLMHHGTLAVSKLIDIDDIAEFPAGTLTITED